MQVESCKGEAVGMGWSVCNYPIFIEHDTNINPQMLDDLTFLFTTKHHDFKIWLMNKVALLF